LQESNGDGAKKRKAGDTDSEDDKPLSKKVAAPKKAAKKEDSDDEDDKPLSKRVKEEASQSKSVKSEKPKVSDEEKAARKQEREEAKARREAFEAEAPTYKWWEEGNQRTDGLKWDYLEHKGVIFAPAYEAHNISIIYDGKKVELTPAQEEPATWYAVMRESPYMEKKLFRDNFWKDWKEILGKKHKIQSLTKCDFTPIWEWHLVEKEKKNNITTEQKKKNKLEKEELEREYGLCKLDNHKEKIGNFRVEPPGLFRGRGEHPKQGCIKGRIMPEDLTLNMSADAPVPKCPVEGHNWGEVKHDNTVTWLAMYKDTIMGETKYVYLNAQSSFKGMSDYKKFEKARELGKHIDRIRKDYRQQLTSSDNTVLQRATALYLIDKLALRVGGAKDDDEADTVGCCSLREEHIELLKEEEEDIDTGKTETKYKVHFDFLGKDSIRYDQTHALDKGPWTNLKKLKEQAQKRVKKHGAADSAADLFDELEPSRLNSYLKGLMDGLTGKVFRTYNASRTLDMLLQEAITSQTIQEKLIHYNRCNRDVAILCNHQKAKPKGFDESLVKVDEKIAEAEEKYKQAKRDYKKAKEAGDKSGTEKLKRQVHTLKERLENKKGARQTKEDLATVSLGTSKINYLDPRISVAWCKTQDVPIEKVFNKSLVDKFPWAMDVDAKWRFQYSDDPTKKKSLILNDAEDSDDDEPLIAKVKAVKASPAKKKAPKRKAAEEDSDDDDKPLSARATSKDEEPPAKKKKAGDTDSDDDDDVPLSKRSGK